MTTPYPLHRIKVVLLENIHQRADELLSAAGFTVERHKVTYEGDELLRVAGDAQVIGLRSKTLLTREFLSQAKNLWAIGAFCIGTNQIDLEYAAGRGIPVFNAPFSNTRSVAEKVIAEVIALHRQLFDRSTDMHQGRWYKTASGSHEIRGRTLGIVGYGRIGSQVSVLAEAMGMRVLYHDIEHVLSIGNASPVPSLATLLEQSDVVTLHVPATPDTEYMIRAEQLALMKPGAILLNNARGNVVDIDDLAAAIREGRLGGAAVDVFPQEPRVSQATFQSPLMGLPNVILTPHVGGSTLEAQEAIAVSSATRLIRLMNNGTTATAVNVPQVQLPRLHQGCHRVLHYHRNVPGVLGELHSKLTKLGVNIVAEYLQTNIDHAYAIVDIEGKGPGGSDFDDDLKRRLAEVTHTISVRTLW